MEQIGLIPAFNSEIFSCFPFTICQANIFASKFIHFLYFLSFKIEHFFLIIFDFLEKNEEVNSKIFVSPTHLSFFND